MDENRLVELSIDMFDFALGSKKRKNAVSTSKQSGEMGKTFPEETKDITEPEPENLDLKEDGKITNVVLNCVIFWSINQFQKVSTALKFYLKEMHLNVL